jgi:predicted nucleotidyltransferase component of viral defense system
MNFTPNTEYLPENTLKVLNEFRDQNFISDYTLVGGTALAIQIQHRFSEDLDFVFDKEELSINSIKRNINRIFPDHRIIRQNHKWQIDFIISGVKVTFFSTGAVAVPFPVKDYSFGLDALNIANAKVIAVLKFSTIAQRNTIRDYFDLYCLSRYHFSLLDLIRETKLLLPNLSPITYTETLVYTKDIEEDDLAGHLSPREKISKQEIAEYFRQELIKIRNLL